MKEFKCWKKETNMRNLKQWSHKRNDEVISVQLASVLTQAKRGYLVIDTSYPSHKKTFDPKYFKSKSQALNFAENYMKGNDKC